MTEIALKGLLGIGSVVIFFLPRFILRYLASEWLDESFFKDGTGRFGARTYSPFESASLMPRFWFSFVSLILLFFDCALANGRWGYCRTVHGYWNWHRELALSRMKKRPNSERSDSPQRESGRRLNKPGNDQRPPRRERLCALCLAREARNGAQSRTNRAEQIGADLGAWGSLKFSL